jgi:hypothetical protein
MFLLLSVFLNHFFVYKRELARPSCRSVCGGQNPVVKEKSAVVQDDSAAKLQKLAEEKRFRQKEAMAQRGGSEAFLRWLRSDAVKKA